MRSLQQIAERKAMIAEIKRVIAKNDGQVSISAGELGVKFKWLSNFLNTNAMRKWWAEFKWKRKKRNEMARKQRCAERKRLSEMAGGEGTYGYADYNPPDGT